MAANRIQLQNALHKPYDRVLFSREVLSPVFGSGFTLNSSLVPASISPNKSESAAIDKVWIYGKIQLDDSTEITCYEVLLQPKVRIEQSKVAIQQYVRKLLTAGQAALINFVAPANKNVWRLTLVAKDSVLTEKGVKEKTTNAKRYTFLLGPSETCKTAAERFETLSTEKEITFQTLVNAFSVEKLSKAFFDEYTLHYQNFCDYLQESNYRKSVFNITFPAGATKQDKDKASKPIRDFVKKLLGRIVFLYFVQKKGWLGASDTNYTNGLGDFIKQLFNKSGGNDTFYSNWLTILFFDTLNKERANDDFTMPDGKIVKVPFLNGGLFDKEDFDEHLLTFKSKLFHNPDFEDAILTAKSNGFARGFLDFLDAFNFTVYEDSPDDHTVAVDPEMLGHIFENLLEDNKDKGAFYTPKEIVHYMCQESLIEYLSTGLQNDYTVYRQIGKEQIELFGNETRTGQLKIIEELGEKGLDKEEVAYMVKNKDISKLTQKQLLSIDRLLDNVKICDPAIGSGAFPMGLLQEIFSIKELIAYETGKVWKPAEAKLNIIQNSIYGVDIEKGAVDIARLRFWLSLVVDEEKPKALPNLDYKIVVGDSLISKFDGEIVEIDWEIKEGTQTDIFGNENLQKRKQLLKTLTEKQRKYFDPANKNKKALALEIRNHKIDVLINQLELMVKTKGLEQLPVKTNYKDNKKFVAAQERYTKTQGWLKTINKSTLSLCPMCVLSRLL
jgi:adenine-specific DNA-methyltransferase